jgi:thioredoxin reductase
LHIFVGGLKLNSMTGEDGERPGQQMVEQAEIVRDVVVVGGGAAGLSAALILARSRRRVTVVDAGAPRNAPAQAVHGLLALDGLSPLELLRRGRDEVTGYGGEVISAEVSDRGDDT